MPTGTKGIQTLQITMQLFNYIIINSRLYMYYDGITNVTYIQFFNLWIKSQMIYRILVILNQYKYHMEKIDRYPALTCVHQDG